MVVGKYMMMVVRHDHLAHIAGGDWLSVDNEGNFDAALGQFFERFFQFVTLLGTRCIIEDRFVFGVRGLDNCVIQEIHDNHHGSFICYPIFPRPPLQELKADAAPWYQPLA